MKCHICGGDLEKILDFGMLPLANAYVSDVNYPEKTYRGIWAWCSQCSLLQLAYPPDAKEMFTGDYPYKTSTSKTMLSHFEKTARSLTDRYNPKRIIEIGCSDGGMIQFMDVPTRFGFEPSESCHDALRLKGIGHDKYFGSEAAFQLMSQWGEAADLIYSANTLRSIPGLSDILKAANFALRDRGILIIEEPYLLSILEGNEFDQFYDENVFCFTATSMDRIADLHGFSLIDVERVSTHGGSMRYHMQKGRSALSSRVIDAIVGEVGVRDLAIGLGDKAIEIVQEFCRELESLRSRGNRVVGYGATAKSSTCLCLGGIDASLISGIYDNTPDKIGKYTPVSHVPIWNAEQFETDPADTVVLLAWNHAKEITAREIGRKWLVYAPEVKYYD